MLHLKCNTISNPPNVNASAKNEMDTIESRGIRSEIELLALANERPDDSLDDLKTFIADTVERVNES